MNIMKEKKRYLVIRKLSFWSFFFAFIIFTPIIVFYSLGYKFDAKSKKFLKTGIISIKSFPKAADVYLDATKISEETPCILREVLPGEYVVTLERDGFYPYQVPVVVKPSLVSEMDVMLVPKVNNVEKFKYNFNVYKFFISKHFFGEKIIILADKGVYLLDSDFKNIERISSYDFTETLANTVLDFREATDKLMFWSQNTIWIIDVTEFPNGQEKDVIPVYKAEEYIKDVFFGLKERYLIINDGFKIIALDIQNPGVYFTIFELKSLNAKIFYDSRSETLYIRDKIPQSGSFSLFRIELMPLVKEKRESGSKNIKPLFN